jgi:cation:H+ antiporter
MEFAGLIISLILILLAAEGFTNGVEVLGRRLAFSQAVVGSVLAAVGTALPETILPMVAIFSASAGHAGKDIGVGAILGAPFMLATAGFFLVGITSLFMCHRNKRVNEVRVEHGALRRDLSFFLAIYAMAVFFPIWFGPAIVKPLAFLLMAGYVLYVVRTVQSDSPELEHFEGLHLLKMPIRWGWMEDKDHSLFWVVTQIACALLVMVSGAHMFVKNLEIISTAWGMNPLLFALLIAPVATELPEKFNSVTWTLKGKDALAVGNITGAMVFQSAFPVSVGLLCTSWQVTGLALVSAFIALGSAALLLIASYWRGRISPWLMAMGGLLYAGYALAVVLGGR